MNATNLYICISKAKKMLYESRITIGNTANYIDRIWIGNWDYNTTIREVMPNTNICVLLQLGNIPKYKNITKEFLKNVPADFIEWNNRISANALTIGNAIIGPHRDLIMEKSEGNTYTIGIEFKTGHSSNFFGIPLKTLSNNILPLGDANGLLCTLANVINTQSNDTIFSSILEYIEKITDSPYSNIKDQKLMECIKAIERNPFKHNVNDLAEIYCTSKRNLNRIINAYTGLPAQQFIMIQKAKKIVSLMIEHLDYSLNQIIDLCNYHDQSHLNRDIKLIGGITATQVFQNIHNRISYMPSPLAMNIVEGKYCGLHLL